MNVKNYEHTARQLDTRGLPYTYEKQEVYNMNPNNLGNLAYYDSMFSGLVPCKVTGFDGYNTVYFTVTANRGAYRRGHNFVAFPHRVVPRKMVHVRNGQYIIRHWYTWINGINGTYAIQTTR